MSIEGRDTVAQIFEAWLAERYPGTRWIVRPERDEPRRPATGPREISRQHRRSQEPDAPSKRLGV